MFFESGLRTISTARTRSHREVVFLCLKFGMVECPRSGRQFLSSRRGLFEGLRADATEMAMVPGTAVAHFNVIEDIHPGHALIFIVS